MGATTGITTVTGIPGKLELFGEISPLMTIKHRTKLSPVIGHGLRVVAGGGGDDSLPLLGLLEHEQRVPGPPLLETAGVLHVLLLQIDVHSGFLRHVRPLEKYYLVI